MPPVPAPHPLPARLAQPADLRTLLRAVGPCWAMRLPDPPSWRPQLRFEQSLEHVQVDELPVPDVNVPPSGGSRAGVR